MRVSLVWFVCSTSRRWADKRKRTSLSLPSNCVFLSFYDTRKSNENNAQLILQKPASLEASEIKRINNWWLNKRMISGDDGVTLSSSQWAEQSLGCNRQSYFNLFKLCSPFLAISLSSCVTSDQILLLQLSTILSGLFCILRMPALMVLLLFCVFYLAKLLYYLFNFKEIVLALEFLNHQFS